MILPSIENSKLLQPHQRLQLTYHIPSICHKMPKQTRKHHIFHEFQSPPQIALRPFLIASYTTCASRSFLLYQLATYSRLPEGAYLISVYMLQVCTLHLLSFGGGCIPATCRRKSCLPEMVS